MIDPSYIQNIKQLIDRPRLWVVRPVFILVCMIDSRCLETNPRLWVVHALKWTDGVIIYICYILNIQKER
jgi:hypothetical protein